MDLFECIENDIAYFENKGSIYLIGDYNSRVGVKRDFVVLDRINEYFDDHDYVPDNNLTRASMDKTCNAFGTKLLDLCISNNLRIVNGRLGCDLLVRIHV